MSLANSSLLDTQQAKCFQDMTSYLNLGIHKSTTTVEESDRGVQVKRDFPGQTTRSAKIDLHSHHIHALVPPTPTQLRRRKRTSPKIQLLRRNMWTDIEIEDVHRKTHGRARVRNVHDTRYMALDRRARQQEIDLVVVVALDSISKDSLQVRDMARERNRDLGR